MAGGTKPSDIQWPRVIIMVCLNVIGRITLRTDARILKAIGYLPVGMGFLWVLASPLTQILRCLTATTRTVIGTVMLYVRFPIGGDICLVTSLALAKVTVRHFGVAVVLSQFLFLATFYASL